MIIIIFSFVLIRRSNVYLNNKTKEETKTL